MKRFKSHKINNKNTIAKKMIIVFFCIFICAIILFNIYAHKINKSVSILVNDKIDKIIYEFFNELITDDVINNKSVNNLLEINKNNNNEILSVNYNLEKTYEILTNVTKILEDGIENLENGKITIDSEDFYLKEGNNGLVLNIPLFINSKNIFLNNLGPKIPVVIKLSNTILTNIKTKVTDYGFNNALLEIYITVEMQKLIITPMEKENKKLNYDILIASLVVNGRVPEFYGNEFQTNSGFLSN